MSSMSRDTMLKGGKSCVLGRVHDCGSLFFLSAGWEGRGNGTRYQLMLVLMINGR